MKRPNPLVLILQITVVVAISVGVVFVAAHFWPNAGGTATCLKTHCFCEVNRGGLIKQAINTMSSLAFVAAAAYAWIRMGDKRAYRLFQGFIVSMLIIGLGSAYYHATLSFAGQWLDVAGMYLFGTLMICASLLRAAKITKTQAVAVFVACNIFLESLQAFVPDARRYLFALLLVTALGLEFALQYRSRDVKYLWYAIGLMATAYLVWTLDQFQIICIPTSFIQGHAIWHLLDAFAAYFVVLHFYPKATDKLA